MIPGPIWKMSCNNLLINHTKKHSVFVFAFFSFWAILWRVVYGHSSGRICGGATGSHVTENDVTGSDVSHETGSSHDRKCVLCMRNRKLRNIRPSRALSPEVTGTGNERDIISPRFPPYFLRFFRNFSIF